MSEKRHHGPPFPPDVQKVADKFFAHKKKHPEPVAYNELTPLQKRVQSGFPHPGEEPPELAAELSLLCPQPTDEELERAAGKVPRELRKR